VVFQLLREDALARMLVAVWGDSMGETRKTPEHYMDQALALAREAERSGEVPVGALLVAEDGRVLSGGRNWVETGAPLRHAEMEALEAALTSEGRRGLARATLYVTAEPCLMCLGAMVLARIGGLIYACAEPRFGGVALLQDLWREGRYPHRFPISEGLRRDEARALLQGFFEAKRKER
jgi:tRNA(adenine34) deaminase